MVVEAHNFKGCDPNHHSSADGREEGDAGGVEENTLSISTNTLTTCKGASSDGGENLDACGLLAYFILRRCALPGSHLDQRVEEARNGMRAADWSVVLFSTTPVTGGIDKWHVRLILFVAATTFFAFVFMPGGILAEYLTRNRFTTSHIAFTTVSTRDGSVQGHKAGIDSLDLMLDGCRQSIRPNKSYEDGPTYHLIYEQPVTANSYLFETLKDNLTISEDPIVFEIRL